MITLLGEPEVPPCSSELASPDKRNINLEKMHNNLERMLTTLEIFFRSLYCIIFLSTARLTAPDGVDKIRPLRKYRIRIRPLSIKQSGLF